jgi:CheY-like chemotaxis protein
VANHRVLVVDDDAAFGRLLRRVVTGAGHDVEAVTNPSDILERYDLFKPDIIFLDLFMPDMDGFEVANWLSDRGFDGKLVFVSGHDPRFSAMARRLAEARGSADVITLGKPIRVNQIRDVLDGNSDPFGETDDDEPYLCGFQTK